MSGVEVEHAKTYQTAIISEKKNHYIGRTGIEGIKPDVVGMEGDKSDRPKWINTVFRQIAHDILVSSNPIDSLKRAVADLELGNVNPELLKRSTRLSKNPEEYENENDSLEPNSLYFFKLENILLGVILTLVYGPEKRLKQR